MKTTVKVAFTAGAGKGHKRQTKTLPLQFKR